MAPDLLFRISRVTSLTLLATLALTVAGCGGGGEDDDDEPLPTGWATPPAPPAAPAPGATQPGIFLDAAVQGIDYESGGLTGTTNARGRFEYASGAPVTFRIGNVVLGSGLGRPLMTTMNLAELGSDLLNQVRNKHRFLQMLDADGNPDNGIVISENVRAVAVDWAQVDFTTEDLPTALADIIAAASAADGREQVLPDVAAADAHFFRSFVCAHSGLFRGNFSGTDNGVFAIVTYGNGQMRGVGFSNLDRTDFDLQTTSAMGITILPTFSAGFAGTGATFGGRFLSPDHISGSWTNNGPGGGFAGLRTHVANSPVYRFTGWNFPEGFPVMLLSVEIGEQNTIQGVLLDTDLFGNGSPVSLTGSLNGSEVSLSGGRYTLTGTVNGLDSPTDRRLSGNVRDSGRNRSFGFTLSGCRL